MASLIQHLTRLIDSHTVRFGALPEVTVPSAELDDDTVSWWSDMAYMRALVDELLDIGRTSANTVTCPIFEQILNRPTLVDPEPLNLCDHDLAGELLTGWRIRLAAQRDWIAWWLNERKREGQEAAA